MYIDCRTTNGINFATGLAQFHLLALSTFCTYMEEYFILQCVLAASMSIKK